MSAKLATVTPLFAALPDESQGFVLWWYRYPRKQGRQEALRAWARLSEEDRATALDMLPAHVAQWQLSSTSRRYIPHPATWLNQRRFEDEIEDLNAPLMDLGQCDWNRNGTREPGQPRCAARATVSNEKGVVYCNAHAAPATGRRPR